MSKQQALAAIEQAQQLHLQRRQISQLTATLMFKHNINPGGLELTLILGNGAQSCNEKAIAYWVNKQMASIMQCSPKEVVAELSARLFAEVCGPA